LARTCQNSSLASANSGVCDGTATGNIVVRSAPATLASRATASIFYPNANCQNKGPGNPYTDPNWRRDGGGWSTGQWSSGQTVGVAPTRPPRTRTAPTPYR
jgi:hypothetical protein